MIPIRDVNPTRIVPVLTWALIAANIAIFAFVQPRSEAEDVRFTYENAAIACEIRTGDPLDIEEVRTGVCSSADRAPQAFPDKSIALSVFASMFLHGGILHLLFNMWSLWIFGNNVEEAFGRIGYLAMYLSGGVVATLGFVVSRPDSTVPLVGASGAIAAVIGAYLVLFPTHRILTWFGFIFFIPVPAVVFIAFWFISQFGIGSGSNVAWEAHVAGFLFGAAVALLAREMLLRRVRAHQQVQWPGVP